MSSSSNTSFYKLLRQFEAQYAKKDHTLIRKLKYWYSRLKDRPLFDISEDLVRSELVIIADTPTQVGNGRSSNKSNLGHRKRANSTINSYKAALSTICNFAIYKGMLKANPCRGIRSLPLDNRRERYLTQSEVQDLLVACKASDWKRLYLLVLMAVTTGARKGELLSLKWKYIELKEGIAHLPDTKNGRPRDLPLTERVIAELIKIRGVGDALVFPSERKPDKPFEFRKQWIKALTVSGIEIGEGKRKVVFHSLRHTAASHLVMNGISSLEVAGIMGHKSLQTTLRYTHTDNESKKKVIDSVMGGIK